MENALPPGSLILNGRYRLTRLLYQRPRVNLYLGQRLRTARQDEPFVAIRELTLSGLPLDVQAQIEQAAREEFHSPGVVSSLRLPGTIERMWLHSERERNYLILPLSAENAPGSSSLVGTLADLLQQPRWPRWLDTQTALTWGVQLCRIVARLHRLGTLLGELDPATVLIDRRGPAPWSPLLLVFWPPSPQFWRAVDEGERRAEDEGGQRAEASSAPTNHENAWRHFPVAFPTLESAFAAPELGGGEYDERADVYALGAILYLLLTGYAPASALRRLASTYDLNEIDLSGREYAGAQIGERVGAQCIAPVECDGANNAWELELISPRLLRPQISLTLEHILMRSLALDPTKRYSSLFSLLEALETVQELREGVYATGRAIREPLFTRK